MVAPAKEKGRNGFQRRPNGWLHDQIKMVLRASKKPLSAQTIARSLQKRHPDTYVSAVFRALAKMLAVGQVERVELLSAYVLTRAESRVALVCRACGTYAEVGGAPTDELSAAVHATGFTPTRLVLEMDGLCSECSST